jgi:hypothetical protein
MANLKYEQDSEAYQMSFSMKIITIDIDYTKFVYFHFFLQKLHYVMCMYHLAFQKFISFSAWVNDRVRGRFAHSDNALGQRPFMFLIFTVSYLTV